MRSRADGSRVAALLDGYRASAVIAAARELGVFEALRERRLDLDALARATGVARDPLRRLLRALHALELVALGAAGAALRPRGRELAGALADRARLAAREYLPAWSALARGLVDATPAAHAVLGCDTWTHRANDPQTGAAFDRTSAAGQDAIAAALLRAVRFPPTSTIVDVGGGAGALLIGFLRRRQRSRGVVLEQSRVARAARAAIAEARLGDRCRVRAGSFFARVPRGGDVYVLQHVLHDFADDRAAAILARVRAACAPGARVLVIESLLPARGAPPLELALLDLHMLVMHGGRERTRAELEDLLAAAGFAPERCARLRGERHVIEARAA